MKDRFPAHHHESSSYKSGKNFGLSHRRCCVWLFTGGNRRAGWGGHKETEDQWVIKALDLETHTIEVLTTTRPGAEDYAWTPDGKIVMGEGAFLYKWSSEAGWSELADLSIGGVNQITRLDIDASGSQIAVVIQ